MRWKSQPLIAYTGRLAETIIHGHVVTDSRLPEIYKSRVGLDTGAYYSNKLSAMLLPDDGSPPFFLVSSGSQNEPYLVQEVQPRLLKGPDQI